MCAEGTGRPYELATLHPDQVFLRRAPAHGYRDQDLLAGKRPFDP